MSLVQKIHHVAYRCKDAKQTVDWYEKHLGMRFVLAIAENEVPSTGAYDPYMHVFLDAGNGNVLAFFELPNQPEMGRDPNTPAWVQHLALQVDSLDTLVATKARLEAAGIEVIGPTHHTIFQSIYFFDAVDAPSALQVWLPSCIHAACFGACRVRLHSSSMSRLTAPNLAIISGVPQSAASSSR